MSKRRCQVLEISMNLHTRIGIGIANLTEGFVVPGIIISQIHPCFDLGIVSDFAVKTSGLNLLPSEHSPHSLISLHLTHLHYITSILWHD